jgi:hypothetical protein
MKRSDTLTKKTYLILPRVVFPLLILLVILPMLCAGGTNDLPVLPLKVPCAVFTNKNSRQEPVDIGRKPTLPKEVDDRTPEHRSTHVTTNLITPKALLAAGFATITNGVYSKKNARLGEIADLLGFDVEDVREPPDSSGPDEDPSILVGTFSGRCVLEYVSFVSVAKGYQDPEAVVNVKLFYRGSDVEGKKPPKMK